MNGVLTRCAGSGRIQFVSGEVEHEGQSLPRWCMDKTECIQCRFCGSEVKFRVRADDMPPWALVLPHRTNGKPCR